MKQVFLYGRRKPLTGENFKVSELMSAVLYAQLNKINYIKETLNKHYNEIWQLLKDVKGVWARHHEDMPSSIWLENKEFLKELEKRDIAFSRWVRWDLQENPIIKYKNTIFSNNYPWNLKKKRNVMTNVQMLVVFL